MTSTTDADALKFIELAEQAPFDPYIGFLLQLPDAMKSRSPICKALDQYCHDNGIRYVSTCIDTGHKYIRGAFFQTIQGHLEFSGVTEISPSRFVVAKYKRDVLEKYKKVKEEWGELHMGFYFQACDENFGAGNEHGSFFFNFWSWRDAVLFIIRMLRKEFYEYNGQKYPIKMVIEHVLEDSPHYAIFDCDQQISRFQGRISDEQIHAATLNFPREISGKMVESEALNEETVVSFLVKNKSRNSKVSYHFCSTLFGFKDQHARALSVSLSGSSAWLGTVEQYLKSKQDYSCLSDADLMDPLLAFDKAAAPGGANGYLTMFSRKAGSHPFPIYEAEQKVCGGALVKNIKLDFQTPHGPSEPHLSDSDCLWMLYSSCNTIPKKNMALYSHGIILNKLSVDKVRVDRCFLFIKCNRSDRGSNPVQHAKVLARSATHDPDQSFRRPLRGALGSGSSNPLTPFSANAWIPQARKYDVEVPLPAPESAQESIRDLLQSTTPVKTKEGTLPKWFQSVLAAAGDSTQSLSSIPCLDKWKRHLPTDIVSSVTLWRLDKSVCAFGLTRGELSTHNSNGTFIAVDKGGKVVYLACINKKDRITKDCIEGIQIVNNQSLHCAADDPESVTCTFCPGHVHWVRLTEDNFKSLVDSGITCYALDIVSV